VGHLVEQDPQCGLVGLGFVDEQDGAVAGRPRAERVFGGGQYLSGVVPGPRFSNAVSGPVVDLDVPGDDAGDLPRVVRADGPLFRAGEDVDGEAAAGQVFSQGLSSWQGPVSLTRGRWVRGFLPDASFFLDAAVVTRYVI